MRKYLAIVLVCLSYVGFAQTNYVVTFKVNTANITVGSNGLYLGGGVIGGANAVQLSDPDGNGVYEGTDTLSGAGGGNFIFLNSPSWSGDWGTKENLAGLSCADANNYNDRILPSFTQDTTLLFCFGSCATDTVCPTLPTNPDVTFSVDMNGVTSSFTNVYVSGTLNSWSGNANQLTDPDGDGVYEGDINLAAGNYEFKFTYDNWVGQESLDPATADSVCTLTTGAFTNRYITIGSSDTTLPTYCWEECTACQSTYTPTACGDLFFSEYAEGSSNNKYIEIYNPTANPVSLSGYTVYASGNGGSWTNSFTSNATIASGDVYMIANSSLSSTVIGNADTTLSYPSIVHFNGDDALILMNGNDTIDVLGVPGVDPGSSWTVGTGSTANHTLVRKATVDMGSTDWTTGAGEWDVYSQNTWTYSGAHSSNCVVTPNDVTFQVDMNNVTSSFTNVYVSGTVNNWSGNSNQLTDPDGDGVYTGTLSLMPGSYEYKFTYDNWTGQESLDPTLDSACTLTTGTFTNRYATFGNADTTLPVVCWESCASCPVQTDFVVTFMVNTANITVGTNGLYLGGGVIGGANAVQLLDPDNDGIYVGTDTLNGSNGGNFIFLNSPANAWDWNTKENLTGLSCADPNNYNDRILPTFTQDTTLMFCFGTCSTDTSCTVTTTNPDVTFRVDMSNVSASFTNVYVSGTLNGWSGNSNQLTDPDGDGVYEGDINLAAGNYEFKFTYDNWTGQENLDPATADSVCTLTTGIYTNRYITIGSSDTTLPVYCWEECTSCLPTPTFPDVVAINTFNGMDANGVVDSLGAMKWVKVIVTSIDFDGNAGYSFYAEDATDGINIWNFADKSGYTMPMMGDSLYIHGEVAQYRGLTELEPDSIYLVNQNNALPAASVETALDETTESELIQLIGMSVVDPTQWPASGSSANVDITNGTDTMTMRIDSDTDIDGSTAPAGMFDVTGLGSQFDFSSPYDEGYQIFPRMLTDILDYSTIVATKNVTFIVDMRDYSGTYTTVNLNGDFNSWCGTCNPMSDPEGDSIWTVTLPLTADSIEYKFTLDGWTGQENLTSGTACTKTTGIYTNRFAQLLGDTILNGVAWESCAAKAGQVYMTFQVNMSYTSVDSTGVFLAGGTGFGVPGDNEMYPIGDSVYSKTLAADTGFYSMFTFLSANDPSWGAKENIVGKSCAAGIYSDRDMVGYSSSNGLMNDFRYRTCFGQCTTDGSCPAPATPVNVTFQSDRNALLGSFTTAYVSGTMNGWSGDANSMADPDGDGVYTATLSLLPGTYEFKFTADNWSIQETFDPSTSDSVCTLTTGAFTNRVITVGSADTTLPVYCWEECVSCATTATGCDELFFSEYLEGSGNNKVLELFNPTSSAISLSTYEIRRFNNGGTTASTMTFPSSLSIPAYGTYVIANPSSASTILAKADTTSTITYFNGDDAIVLMNGIDTLDIIGVVGVDPGSSWSVDTGATANFTLVRKSTVSAGQTDWTVGATEWNVYPSNTDTYLGAHYSNCTPPAPTFPDVVAINTFNGMDANGVVDSLGAMKWVKVIVTSIDFDGNAGYSFYAEDATDGINIWNFADKSGYTMPMMGDSLYIHGEVAQYRGLTELEPDSIYLVNQNNALPAASVETALDETTESELIQLIGMSVVDPTQWPASGSSANVDITNGTDTMTMRIDSDTDIDGSTAPAGMFDVTGLGSQFDFSSPYDEGYQIFPRMLTDIYEYPTIPLYQISDVTYVDAAGMPDSLNVMCKLEGIVMGVDMQGSATNVSFTIHDGIDGISTFGGIPNYTVTEGDSVRIIGSIGQYNGLLQMYLDSVVLISSNNALPTTPTIVTSLSETTESELIKFENATIVDPSQWSGGSGYSVDITNGTDTIVMRIDADTDLYGTAAPTGAFDVTGIGGQFTFNAGNFDGYQILPRYQADIVPAAAVYVPKIVVSEMMPGSNASSWDADWFEIYNYGDTVVDLAGMSWDDESGISGTSTFPSVTIAPGEAVVVWDDVAANEDSLLVSWKLYPGSVQVISTDELTGSFPSLSQNGDGVYLFDAAGIELTKSEYISATAGYSIEFDTTGASLGDAVDGVNGAYTSLNGDVGSPGNLTPNTGAGEFTLNGRIYPNPNTGQFNIEMDRTDNYTVEVMDVRGAVLSRMTVEGNTISVDVNVSAGMYLVRVSSARGTVTQRVQVL